MNAGRGSNVLQMSAGKNELHRVPFHENWENSPGKYLPCLMIPFFRWMDGRSELIKCPRRRMNEKWSDPEFNLESDEDNCLQGLVDDTPEGPNIDVVDLKHALRVLNSAPDLLQPFGTVSLPLLGNVLERELPPPKSYPQSVHRVVSTFLLPERAT